MKRKHTIRVVKPGSYEFGELELLHMLDALEKHLAFMREKVAETDDPEDGDWLTDAIVATERLISKITEIKEIEVDAPETQA